MSSGAGGRLVNGTPPTFTFFFFNDTATTEIYTLSLHDALPILTTITYTATDAGGLTATCTFTVTVSPDAQPPVIVGCPANIGPVAMDSGACGALVSWTAPTVAGKCPRLNFRQTAGPATGCLFPPGVTTITYTATD